MYQVEYSKQSIRTLRRMPSDMAMLIRRKVEMVAQDPVGAQGVKKLVGRDGYRLRVGDWRVLYLLDGQRLRVLVMESGPRGRYLSMNVQTIDRDGKPEYVVLAWADYQALLAAAEDAIDGALLDASRKKLAAGEDETVPAAVVDALLAGANPVKVWREYRGLTQENLAAMAGISKAYLCQIETGKREGAIKTLRSLAAALGVTVDDLE